MLVLSSDELGLWLGLRVRFRVRVSDRIIVSGCNTVNKPQLASCRILQASHKNLMAMALARSV